MSNEPLFVKPNVRIEGLINQFCAWLHVTAPVPAAMNMANLHMPMLDSYVEQPQVHADAVANPKMKGSFFINIDGSRVEEVRELRDTVKRENDAQLRLAAAVKKAENLLRAQASGYDLTPLYEQLPAELDGIVELVYDINNHPQLRFLEAMMYRSEYFRRDLQSIDLSLDDGSEPPFALSTPRLPGEGHLQLPLALDDEAIDEFFALRDKPRPFEDICGFLGVTTESDRKELRSLLTTESVIPEDRSIDSGGRIRYFGHACLLLQDSEVSIMVDPFISSNPAEGDRFTYVDLPDHIDYVLITHGHQDHVVPETLLQMRNRIGTVVVPRNGGGHRQDPSLRLFLESMGFNVREVDDFDEITFSGGSITATPFLGEHCDLDVRAKSTYVVRMAGRSTFLGADSSGLDPYVYRRIRTALGDAVDYGFLGMECDGAPLTWLYSSLFTQPVPRKMSITRKLSGSNALQALGIVEELGIKNAYVYAMGQEDWLQHIMATSYTPDSYQLQQVAEFLRHCAERDVAAEHLLVRKEIRW